MFGLKAACREPSIANRELSRTGRAPSPPPPPSLAALFTQSCLSCAVQEDIDMSCLRRTNGGGSFCEWKGSAIYYDVVVSCFACHPATLITHGAVEGQSDNLCQPCSIYTAYQGPATLRPGGH